MTKLICPIPWCRQCSFGVSMPHQGHVEQHILAKHNIVITPGKRPQTRLLQDQLWNDRQGQLTRELNEACARYRTRVREAVDEGKEVLGEGGDACLALMDDLQGELGKLAEVEDDDEGEGEEGFGQQGWFGMGRCGVAVEEDGGGGEGKKRGRQNYSCSLRHYPIAESRARGWMERERVLPPLPPAERPNPPNEKSRQLLGPVDGEGEASPETVLPTPKRGSRKRKPTRRLMPDDLASRLAVEDGRGLDRTPVADGPGEKAGGTVAVDSRLGSRTSPEDVGGWPSSSSRGTKRRKAGGGFAVI